MTADAETRAEVLAEVRQVLAALAALRRDALEPRAVLPPAADYPPVPWDAPPAATPEKDILEALQAYRAGATLTLPEGLTVQHVGPTPAVLGLLHRLAHLLGLSPLEQEFFTACASDRLLDAFDGRLAYADWLEERGDEAAGLRLRKLTPQPGDVLAYRMPRPGSGPAEWDDWIKTAEAVQESLRRRGVETTWALLPPGAALDRLSAQQVTEAGLVSAARVAEEREACARVAEAEPYCLGVATAIRAREGATP